MIAVAVSMALSDDATDLAGSRADDDLDERAQERRQVELAARGDALAFRAIVERHHRGMYALALRLLRDPAEAEDVVQESFARAFCAIDRFDPTYRLSTWLYGIALNICRDVWKSARVRTARSHAPVSVWSDASEATRPDALLVAQRRSERLWQALEGMRPAYREILVLKDMQELSYQEIQEITGAPITALKIRAIRAREQLRKLIGDEP